MDSDNPIRKRAYDRLKAKIKAQDDWIGLVLKTVLPPSYLYYVEKGEKQIVLYILTEYMIRIENASTDGKVLCRLWMGDEKLGEHLF